jgi:hypothetical protein
MARGKEENMKIFISHAVDESDLAEELVNLLRLGIGVQHGDIFLSSDGTSIPNGVFFVQHILEFLRTADLVIAVLSGSYFKSQFCNAEVGAAQLRRLADSAGLFTLLVPPCSFSDLAGALYGTQSGRIVDPRELSKLRDLITHELSSYPDTATWEKARDQFLRSAKEILERNDLISQIRPLGARISREPGATYKLKLRLRFAAVDEAVEIGPTTWLASSDSIPLFKPLAALAWQFNDGTTWTPQDGARVLSVPAGKSFRTWIGVLDSITDDEIFDRFASNRIGTLVTDLTVRGHLVQREFAF